MRVFQSLCTDLQMDLTRGLVRLHCRLDIFDKRDFFGSMKDAAHH